jgi:hypothetical protein
VALQAALRHRLIFLNLAVTLAYALAGAFGL